MKLIGSSNLGFGDKRFWFSRVRMQVLGMTVFGLVIHSCGTKGDDKKDEGAPLVNASSLVADPQLTSSVVNASHGDAVAATADQSGSGSSLQFTLADGDNDGSSVTKSCTKNGNSAVVSVSSTINRSRTKTSGGGRVTITASRTGEGKSTRTWSRIDGSAVECRSDKGAAVDFKSPSGVKLEVSFERNRSDSMTYTGPKVTRTSSRSFKSSGNRTVTWSSNDTGSDGSTTYVRNKSVVIKDVLQSLTMTNKDGQAVSSNLSINTAENAPLVVKVERDSATNAVVNKTFVSGQVVVKKDSDATITTTYTNLKLNFSDNSCSISDGTAQIVVTDSTGATLKTYTLGKSTDGEDGSLKDSSGSEVDGFALDPCDSEDVKL
jgi:hypothetical protein